MKRIGIIILTVTACTMPATTSTSESPTTSTSEGTDEWTDDDYRTVLSFCIAVYGEAAERCPEHIRRLRDNSYCTPETAIRLIGAVVRVAEVGGATASGEDLDDVMDGLGAGGEGSCDQPRSSFSP